MKTNPQESLPSRAARLAPFFLLLAQVAGAAQSATQFTLAGAVNGTTGITVDDYLEVQLNGVVIYLDTSGGAGTRAPFSFMANTGDTLRFIVHDTFGVCSSLSTVFLFNDTHQSVLADPGFSLPCDRPIGDLGVSHDLNFVIPEFHCKSGDIIAAAGYGLVVRVDPVSGKRSVISNFNDALQGPTGFPGNVTAGACGAIYATDQATGGKLFKIALDGTRALVSDGAYPGQGLSWLVPFSLGIDSDGGILVTDRGSGGGGVGSGLWRVDPFSGFRTRITDSGAANGNHSSPESVMLDADGNLLVGDTEGPHWLGGAGTYCWEYGDCGALFRVDRATGALTVLTDFGDALQGTRGEDGGHSMAMEGAGSVLMVDPYYMDIGALFRVSISGPAAGTRNILTTGLTHFGTVAIGGDGAVLIGSCNAPTAAGNGICRVDATTGAQTVLSDFGDKSQGVTGLPLSIAVVPIGNFVFANGFEP